jgi:glycosyltransferase involved in cell wall biosynthesis
VKTGVTACLITYNEAYWLERTLPGMVAGADRLVIIDGGPFGPSDDGSQAIIRRHLRRPGDVYERGQFGGETDAGNWDIVMRNRYLRYVETSHILLIDADEAYLPEDWAKLREYAEKGVAGVLYSYIHFYMDDKHRLAGGFWDAPCHHFTCFRPEFRYMDISTVLRRPDRTPVIAGMPFDATITLFHYNRMSPPEVYRAKQAKFWRRSDGGGISPEEYARRLAGWKDDRQLDNPEVVAWEGRHPLEGLV